MKSVKPRMSHHSSQDSRQGEFPTLHSALGSFIDLDFPRRNRVKGLAGIAKPFQLDPWILKDHKNTEQRIRQNMSVLQAIFDGIPDPLLLLDGDFTVNMPPNTAAADYYGVTKPQEVIGKRCYEAFRRRPEPCEGCPYLSVLINGRGGTFERKGLMDPDRFEEVTIFPTEIGVLIRIKDITRTKLMERQLIQSQKLASLGLLVSGIVHEIKNLNNCITFNIPILREYLKELLPIIDDYAERKGDLTLFGMSYRELREDIFKLLGNLEHASDRISATVSGLREFAKKSDRGTQRWVDLKRVTERAVDICRCQVEKMVKTFEVDISGSLPRIFSDPEGLEQVIVNLLINAAQAADKEDCGVRLSVKQGNRCRDHVVIEVSDNGCGMDEEIRGKLFEPFFSTKRFGGGTGLGLFVSHNLIKELGGRIEVESEPGRGSTFRIILDDL